MVVTTRRSDVLRTVRRRLRPHRRVVGHRIWDTLAVIQGRSNKAPIRIAGSSDTTAVDQYLNRHTVNSRPPRAAIQSARYLRRRRNVSPRFREHVRAWGDHANPVLLDFGCGPGDDVVGLDLYSNAKRMIGIDHSHVALHLLQDRLALHRVSPGRVDLVLVNDLDARIPLDTGCVDYVHSGAVLHHSTTPKPNLQAFWRVLRPVGEARIMAYNACSVWLRSYTAYELMVIRSQFEGVSAREACQPSTAGVECPIARCYEPEEFSALCEVAGFHVEYVGGCLSRTELACLAAHHSDAIHDERLASAHRDFLRRRQFDIEGRPLYQTKNAGVGGVVHLEQPSSPAAP